MMASVDQASNDSATTRLIEQVIGGDDRAWETLLNQHRERLRRMIALRLHDSLQGRVDPSDIIQEASLDAVRRLPEYVRNPEVSFFLWLRFLTAQRLQEQHRRHLGARARDARREISLDQPLGPGTTSAALAAQLLGRLSSPSEAAIRHERRLRLQDALNALEPLDREVLALRHYEQLSNGETALLLGIDKSAASKRYARALIRLKQMLADLPGGGG
jgi:RNA polymerase sigma-70 factor (ECF subfamily)